MLYAVSYINWFDYELITEFHSGATWKEALVKHSKIGDSPFNDGVPVPDTLEQMKQLCFDCDCMIEVKQVPHA